MRKWKTINYEKELNLSKLLKIKNIISGLGLNTPYGKRISKNSKDLDQYLKDVWKWTIKTLPPGLNMQIWRCEINLSTMPEIYGKEPPIYCPESTNFGINILIWRNYQETMYKQEFYSSDG